MWLQKIVSDFKKRIQKREEQLDYGRQYSDTQRQPPAKKRIQHFQARLLDLDRRLAELS